MVHTGGATPTKTDEAETTTKRALGLIFFIMLIYPITVLNRAVSGFIFPTLTALNANRASPREQGVLMGVTTALGSLMSILGPLWAGVVYDRVMVGAPYWMGAVVYVLAALALVRPASRQRLRRPGPG